MRHVNYIYSHASYVQAQVCWTIVVALANINLAEQTDREERLDELRRSAANVEVFDELVRLGACMLGLVYSVAAVSWRHLGTLCELHDPLQSADWLRWLHARLSDGQFSQVCEDISYEYLDQADIYYEYESAL